MSFRQVGRQVVAGWSQLQSVLAAEKAVPDERGAAHGVMLYFLPRRNQWLTARTMGGGREGAFEVLLHNTCPCVDG